MTNRASSPSGRVTGAGVRATRLEREGIRREGLCPHPGAASIGWTSSAHALRGRRRGSVGPPALPGDEAWAMSVPGAGRGGGFVGFRAWRWWERRLTGGPGEPGEQIIERCGSAGSHRIGHPPFDIPGVAEHVHEVEDPAPRRVLGHATAAWSPSCRRRWPPSPRAAGRIDLGRCGGVSSTSARRAFS